MDGMATGGKRMGQKRAWMVAVWVGTLAAAAIGAGCDGGSPPEQSGVQRLGGRDFDHLFFWNEQTPTFTRQTAAPGNTSQDFWVWPDSENAPRLALSQIQWSPPGWSPRIFVGDILMTGGLGEKVYDLRARTSLDLYTVVEQGTSTGDGLEWASVRRDGDLILAGVQHGPVLAGRATAFTFIPPPYVAWSADFMGDDLAVTASTSSMELNAQSLYRMALPSGDVTRLPVAPLNYTYQRCASFSTPPCRTIRVVGCGADDPVCPETGRAPCAILYPRGDAKSLVAQPYVFDVNTGQETALPGTDPNDFVLSPDRHSAAWTHVVDDYVMGNVSPEEAPIYVHNFCNGAAAQGSLPGPKQLAWRADGGELVVELADFRVGLIDAPTGSSSFLGSGQIGQHGFSPAGDRLAWTVTNVANDLPTQLWIGDPAGAGARMIADDVFSFAFSPDGQALYIVRITGEGGQFSLSWLSLAADSPSEQLIANPYSGATLRGNQRVLVIDHWNTQDGSGNLDLVDLRSGARQVLAHAVTGLAGSSSVDGAARVLYSVRGRFASAQDGLWETTLPAP